MTSMVAHSRGHCLTPELERARVEIEQHARDYGLDFYKTIFEILDFEEMNMVAAYGGFPNRYPHWKFGLEYERLKESTRTVCQDYELSSHDRVSVLSSAHLAPKICGHCWPGFQDICSEPRYVALVPPKTFLLC